MRTFALLAALVIGCSPSFEPRPTILDGPCGCAMHELAGYAFITGTPTAAEIDLKVRAEHARDGCAPMALWPCTGPRSSRPDMSAPDWTARRALWKSGATFGEVLLALGPPTEIPMIGGTP